MGDGCRKQNSGLGFSGGGCSFHFIIKRCFSQRLTCNPPWKPHQGKTHSSKLGKLKTVQTPVLSSLQRLTPSPPFGLLKTHFGFFFFLRTGDEGRWRVPGVQKKVVDTLELELQATESRRRRRRIWEYGGVMLVPLEAWQALLTVKPSLQPLSVFNFNSIFSRWSFKIPISAASPSLHTAFQSLIKCFSSNDFSYVSTLAEKLNCIPFFSFFFIVLTKAISEFACESKGRKPWHSLEVDKQAGLIY